MTFKHSLIYSLALAGAFACGPKHSGTNTSPNRVGENPSTYPSSSETTSMGDSNTGPLSEPQNATGQPDDTSGTSGTSDPSGTSRPSGTGGTGGTTDPNAGSGAGGTPEPNAGSGAGSGTTPPPQP